MGMKVRIRGVNTYIRDLARTNDATYRAARKGVVKAAEYLLEKVVAKIGKYQPTGGLMGGRGKWPKLKDATIRKKLYRYNVGDKPLYMTGELKDSFKVVEGGRGTLSASVGSDSDYLVHHVYGAPGANVPRRDPIRVTAVEELDACHKIIEDEIMKELDGW